MATIANTLAPSADWTKRFEEEGAVLLRGLLDAAHQSMAKGWLSALAARAANIPESYQPELEPLYQQEAPSLRKVRRLAWNDPKFWGDFFQSSGLSTLVRTLVDDPVLIFHACFFKPKGIGTAVGFHQDQALWPHLYNGAVTLWLALDATDEDNGALLGVPSSQKRGLLPHCPTLSHPWHPVIRLDGADLPQPQVWRMAAGDGLAWHRYYAHGSGPNRSSRDRCGMVMVFAPEITAGAAVDRFHLR